MTKKPDNIDTKNHESENIEAALEGLTDSMPPVSPMANTIAEKYMNEKQESEKNEEKTESVEKPKKRKRGRPRKSESEKAQNKSRIGGVRDKGESDQAAVDQQRLAASFAIVGAMEMAGSWIAGDDARMGDLEREGMATTWDKYLASKNMHDLPPGAAVVLVSGMYFSRVLVAPKAKPKINGFKLWLANKYNKLRGKIDGARFNRRNDNEREDDSGKTDGDTIQKPGDKDSGARSAM